MKKTSRELSNDPVTILFFHLDCLKTGLHGRFVRPGIAEESGSFPTVPFHHCLFVLKSRLLFLDLDNVFRKIFFHHQE